MIFLHYFVLNIYILIRLIIGLFIIYSLVFSIASFFIAAYNSIFTALNKQV